MRVFEKKTMREGGNVCVGWFDLHSRGNHALLQSNGLVAHIQSHGYRSGDVDVRIRVRIILEKEALREGRVCMGWRGLLQSKTHVTRKLRRMQRTRLEPSFVRPMPLSKEPLLHQWISLGSSSTLMSGFRSDTY
jgi:hypothetical protein